MEITNLTAYHHLPHCAATQHYICKNNFLAIFSTVSSAPSEGSTISLGFRRLEEDGMMRQHSDGHASGGGDQSNQHAQGGQRSVEQRSLTLGDYVVDPNESVKTAEDFQDNDEVLLGDGEENGFCEGEDVESLDDDEHFHTPPSVQRHPQSGPIIVGSPHTSAKRSPHHATPMQFSAVPSSVEIEFEDLVKGADVGQYVSIMEISPDMEDSEINKQTGRWGEALVYNYLQQQSEKSGGSVEVTWVNSAGETGNPYDIVMEKDGMKIYVEVKATRLGRKELFEMSSKEVAFAEKQKERFHLYRVYNVGNKDNIRLCRLQDLASRMERNEVRLYMYV